MSTSASDGTFRCIWGDHDAHVADAADRPATICLDHLDEVAELEERERVSSTREVA